jgi:hypothetical protein
MYTCDELDEEVWPHHIWLMKDVYKVFVRWEHLGYNTFGRGGEKNTSQISEFHKAKVSENRKSVEIEDVAIVFEENKETSTLKNSNCWKVN